jgi:hypothetical protein
VPEQEYLPPRRPARSYRPDHDDEDPPPWANLPPVRPTRPRHAGPEGNDPPAGPPLPPRPEARPGGPQAGPGGPPAGSTSHGRHGLEDPPADPLDPVDFDDPLPEWAGPEADDDDVPRAPLRDPFAPREPGGRALRAAARRRRRWLVMAGGLVVVVGAVIAVVLLLAGGPGPAPVTPGSLITTFQPGELQKVPNACDAVPAATVQQYLPGKAKEASPLPVNGALESACNWTVDQAPVYRLMELNMLAYAPNGLASGDGSATFAAIDGYDSTLAGMRDPGKHSPDPRATVTTLSGFGNQAFSAVQVFHVGGAVTDVATVVVRYHNVVVTVTLNGLEHSNRGDYGPVSPAQLSSAALAFAQAAEASLH